MLSTSFTAHASRESAYTSYPEESVSDGVSVSKNGCARTGLDPLADLVASIPLHPRPTSLIYLAWILRIIAQARPSAAYRPRHGYHYGV